MESNCQKSLQEDWHDIPKEHESAWYSVFIASKEILNLSAPCPVCNEKTLHRWFWNARKEEFFLPNGEKAIGRGGLWEWCTSCRSFAHYRAAVPAWWSCDLEVDTSKLTPYPTEIEEAIRKRET